jgi:phosphatidylglycerol lysyltransferase
MTVGERRDAGAFKGSTDEKAPDTERARALRILRRYGHHSFAFQTLAPGLRYWFDGDDAFVGYADTKGAWVAAGEPIAPPERTADVAQRFVHHARNAGRRARFFGVRASFADRAGLARTFVGEDPEWDPTHWVDTLRRTRSLREQLRRARAKGVRTRLLHPEELGPGTRLRSQLDELGQRWLASRGMAPMGFLLELDPFHHADERLYVAAERDGEVLALLVGAPVHAHQGWLVEHVLRHPGAPNGTTELLIDSFMRSLAGRGCRFVSLGMAPLGGEVSKPLKLARRAGRFLYNFEGLYAFKAKLRPERWEPAYVAYPPGDRSWTALVDVLAAFATGGFARFALECVRHLRRSITWVLAVLLVPWTITLTFAGAHWFPSPAVKWAWVAFDAVLIALMFTLLRRWQRGLVRLLAWLTGVDVLLTAAQVLGYNAPRASGPLEWLVIAVSVLAPTTATLFFHACRSDPRSGIRS